MSTVCLAATVNSEQLRAQLDQLHLEGDHTRAKAYNARMRLMRLSEAAEKLQRLAVICVKTGKENDARELLFQKRKVIQALEKSKSRIELLNELLAKLDEAISVRETQLVETIGLDVEVNSEDASSPVRIVSPKDECTGSSGNSTDSDTDLLKHTEDQNSKTYVQDQANMPSNNDPNNVEGALQNSVEHFVEPPRDDEDILEVPLAVNENNVVSSLKALSSYKDFLEHIDQQLKKIEAEVVMVLRFSTLIVEGEDSPENIKVQQTREILEAVGCIRERIAGIMQTRVEIR